MSCSEERGALLGGRPPAPELSPEERAVVERFEAAPDPLTDVSLNPRCTDQLGNPAWSCIEYDGTGLWCESCLAVAGAS